MGLAGDEPRIIYNPGEPTVQRLAQRALSPHRIRDDATLGASAEAHTGAIISVTADRRRFVDSGVGRPIFTRNVAGCMRSVCERHRFMREVMAYGTERDKTRQGHLRVLQVRGRSDAAKQGIHAEGLS